jgi:hypothetical protein
MVRTRIKYYDDSIYTAPKSNEFHLMYGDKDISWYLFNITYAGLDLIPGLSSSWFSTNRHSTLTVHENCDVI